MSGTTALTGSPAEWALAKFRELGPQGPIAGSIMLRNSVIIALQASRRPDRVTLTYIWVSPSLRGHGDGTMALHQVISIADLAKVEIVVRPHVFDRRHGVGGVATGPATRELIRWYARHGFLRKDALRLLRAPYYAALSSQVAPRRRDLDLESDPNNPANY